MNDDQVKGRADQVKGTIKQKTGQVTGNRDLEDEGTADKGSGKVQSASATPGKAQGRDRQDLRPLRWGYPSKRRQQGKRQLR
jgi:uncharacterized protein YjbJ (UPF0337 family)